MCNEVNGDKNGRKIFQYMSFYILVFNYVNVLPIFLINSKMSLLVSGRIVSFNSGSKSDHHSNGSTHTPLTEHIGHSGFPH
jgi:hypothetical protein